MTDKDRNPDDLLDFKYDHPAPTRKKEKEAEVKKDDFDIFDEFDRMEPGKAVSSKPEKPEKGLGSSYDSYDDFKRYEDIRRRSREKAAEPKSAGSFDAQIYEQKRGRDMRIEPRLGAKHDAGRSSERSGSVFEQYDKERSKNRELVEEKDPKKPLPSAKEIEALKKASHEAHERYKSNYTKNKKKKAGMRHVTKADKILTIVYIVALAAFAGSMTYMNVLPFGILIAMYVVLALISFLILIKTRKNDGKKWSKRIAAFCAVLLVFLYGAGTAYALGTLSFLSHTSVDGNENAVSTVTRDPFNVVITGMDVSGTIDEQGRSDVNMVLTVNPKTATILMTSIPRDYEIYMPDHDNAMDKLTHTGFYSVNTTILAEEQLLDITANYYVKVNFTTVEKFIDAIGGVDVYSEYEFTPVKMKDWTVHEGMNHMNGKQALAFARERKAFADGDNQRIKNQQAVFEAMFKKATSSRTMIMNYNRILTNLKPYFEMSFSSDEIRQLAKMEIAKFPDWGIYKNTIVGGNAIMNTYTAGNAYVMTQDADSIENAKTLINAVLEGKELAKDDEGNTYVISDEQTETE